MHSGSYKKGILRTSRIEEGKAESWQGWPVKVTEVNGW